ncbi:MAG: hypothetical protein BGP13_17265 [Sphingobacteriales bacterium 40-81]|nr:MAG: hypothetical protein BGP13_17265 [Sphingobacteriales bacterium 40-81]
MALNNASSSRFWYCAIISTSVIKSHKNKVILLWYNFLLLIIKIIHMQNWLRTLLAGYGAYKWGGGCLGSILVFVIIYYLLGYC